MAGVDCLHMAMQMEAAVLAIHSCACHVPTAMTLENQGEGVDNNGG